MVATDRSGTARASLFPVRLSPNERLRRIRVVAIGQRVDSAQTLEEQPLAPTRRIPYGRRDDYFVARKERRQRWDLADEGRNIFERRGAERNALHGMLVDGWTEHVWIAHGQERIAISGTKAIIWNKMSHRQPGRLTIFP